MSIDCDRSGLQTLPKTRPSPRDGKEGKSIPLAKDFITRVVIFIYPLTETGVDGGSGTGHSVLSHRREFVRSRRGSTSVRGDYLHGVRRLSLGDDIGTRVELITNCSGKSRYSYLRRWSL